MKQSVNLESYQGQISMAVHAYDTGVYRLRQATQNIEEWGVWAGHIRPIQWGNVAGLRKDLGAYVRNLPFSSAEKTSADTEDKIQQDQESNTALLRREMENALAQEVERVMSLVAILLTSMDADAAALEDVAEILADLDSSFFDMAGAEARDIPEHLLPPHLQEAIQARLKQRGT